MADRENWRDAMARFEESARLAKIELKQEQIRQRERQREEERKRSEEERREWERKNEAWLQRNK